MQALAWNLLLHPCNTAPLQLGTTCLANGTGETCSRGAKSAWFSPAAMAVPTWTRLARNNGGILPAGLRLARNNGGTQPCQQLSRHC